MPDQKRSSPVAKPRLMSGWLPVLVGVLLCLRFGLMAWTLHQREQDNLRNKVQTEAEYLITHINSDLRSRFPTLQRMVKRWEIRRGMPKKEFVSDASAYFSDAPGFQALALVDKNFIVRVAVPLKGNERAQNLNLAFEKNRRMALEEAKHSRSPTVSAPVDLVQGGKGFLVFFPVYVQGKFDGFIVAVFHIEEWLSYVFNFGEYHLSDDFIMSVFFDGALVFRQAGWDDAQKSGLNAVSETRVMDRRLSIHIRPTEAYINRGTTLEPKLAAIFGPLFSILVALSIYLVQKAFMKTWESQAARVALEAESRERKKTADELRNTLSRLDMATKAGGIGIWTWEVATNADVWNERMYELYGIPADVTPTHEIWHNALHPDDVQAAESQLRAAIDGKEVFNGEFRIILPTGDVRYVASAAKAETDYAGRPLRVIGVSWDLTDRRNTEEAIRKSEEQVRLLLNSTAEGIYGIDLEGNCTFANPSSLRMLGYSSMEQLLGKNMHELIHHSCPDGHPMSKKECFILKAFREGKGMHRDDEVFWKSDGASFPAEYWSYPQIASGNVSGAVVTFNDITERRNAEKLLAAERQRLAYILEGTNAGTLEWNIQTGQAVINEQWANMIGYTLAELQPLSTDDLMRLTCPEDLKVAGVSLEKHWRRELQYFEAEVRARHKDGSWVWVLDRGKVVTWTDDGKPLIMSGTRQDIMKRKRMEEKLRASEQRLRNIANSAQDAILMTDPYGRISYWNPAAEQILGYRPEEALEKDLHALVMPERYHAAYLAALPEFRRSGHGNAVGATLDLFAKRKDGQEIPVALSLSAVLQDGAWHAVGIIRDITATKQTEAALREAKEAAEAATQTKSRFLAAVSHEIRTPMNAIIGMAELLLETPLTPDQARYVGVFRNAGESLLNIINDVLDLSKIEAGHAEIESIGFNLEDLMEETCQVMAMQADKKQLEFICHIHPDVPNNLIGDPLHLRQVIVNLVGNAIKFTEKGEVMLEVRKEGPNANPDEASLLFSVRDSGIGIPKEKLDTIFERFTQVDSSTTRTYGGTGLGLPISRYLVEAMGGHMRVESELGKGTKFSFVLPFPLQENVQAKETIEDHKVKIKDMKALIIDDNDTNRMILREMLLGWGCVVDEARDGDSGIARLRNEQGAGKPYNFVLLDYRMPIMNGLEVAEQMSNDAAIRNTPIIMLTSDPALTLSRKACEHGIAECAAKPVRRSELKNIILKVLGQKQVSGKERAVLEVRQPEEQNPLSLLLVEDSEDNRLLIESFLKKYPFTIDIAENGLEGLQQFKNAKYNLVLMDMQMPVMDGYTATREIRNWEEQNGLERTPVVALTAYALKEETQKSIDAGCDAHVTKPIKKATLLETIRTYAKV